MSFQEVVHPVRTGKAEVVKASVILGGPNAHPQECPFDAVASRGDGARRRCGQLSKAHAARTYGVTVKIVGRWVARFLCEGAPGMADRSSRPKRSPKRTAAALADAIATLRRRRLTGKHIAKQTGVSAATVSRVLRRAGLSRLKDIAPAEPVRRYERDKPGEMIHIDIKKLGRFERVGHRITGDRAGQSNSRGIGWEFVPVCIDDASRVAFSQVLPDEGKERAVGFLEAAVAYYNSLGVTVERVMTDNGSCYRSKAFASACRKLDLTAPQDRFLIRLPINGR